MRVAVGGAGVNEGGTSVSVAGRGVGAAIGGAGVDEGVSEAIGVGDGSIVPVGMGAAAVSDANAWNTMRVA